MIMMDESDESYMDALMDKPERFAWKSTFVECVSRFPRHAVPGRLSCPPFRQPMLIRRGAPERRGG